MSKSNVKKVMEVLANWSPGSKVSYEELEAIVMNATNLWQRRTIREFIRSLVIRGIVGLGEGDSFIIWPDKVKNQAQT